MAQVAGATAKSLTAVAPAVSGSMKSRGSSLGLGYWPLVALSAQASVPPLVPTVRTGLPMAMAVVEPSAPSSSVKVRAVRAKDGPPAPQTGTSAEPPDLARMPPSQPFRMASSGSTHTPVPLRSSVVRPVSAVRATGMLPVSPALPLRSRLARALRSASAAGMLPVSPLPLRSRLATRPQPGELTPCQPRSARSRPSSTALNSPVVSRFAGAVHCQW